VIHRLLTAALTDYKATKLASSARLPSAARRINVAPAEHMSLPSPNPSITDETKMVYHGAASHFAMSSRRDARKIRTHARHP